MKELEAAKVYANVLFNLAQQQNSVEKCLADLQHISQLLVENTNLYNALASSQIDHSSKKNIIKQLVGNKVEPIVFNLLIKVIEKNRFKILFDIFLSFARKTKVHFDKFDVEVIVPKPLGPENTAALKERLKESFNKNVMLYETVDHTLIGGMILMFPNNKMLDMSIRTKLNQLEKSLWKGNHICT